MNQIKKNNRDFRQSTVPRLCIWSEADIVSSRYCTRRLECWRCLFDQNMVDFFSGDLGRLPVVPQKA